MSRYSKDPAYRLHRQSGQAIVTLPDGLGGRRDVLLGKHNTPESRDRYYRVLAEWRANGCRLAAPAAGADLTMNELMAAYWQYAEAYYVKDGKPTSEQATIRCALRSVKHLYGETPAREFGPLALKAVRDEMVRQPITLRYKVKDPETGKASWAERVLRQGLTRRLINKQIGRIRRLFAWAVEEELLPVEVYQALLTVKGLKKGKTAAREKPRVGLVPEAFVEAVLPLVPPAVATMIRVQLLTGARPQDIVNLRALDIDRSGPVWEYRPPRHKTEHHNDDASPDRERVVFLGPRAQALLRPYLTLDLAGYLYCPIRSEAERNGQRREGRQTPRGPPMCVIRPANGGNAGRRCATATTLPATAAPSAAPA